MVDAHDGKILILCCPNHRQLEIPPCGKGSRVSRHPLNFLPGADRFWGGKRRLLRRAPGSCPNRNRTYVHILYRKRGDLSREIREIVGTGQFFLGKSGRVSYFTTPLGAGEYVWSGMWRYGVEGDEVWCGEVVWR